MLPPDLVQAIEKDHDALDAIVRGDPEPKKRMFSHGGDVSLANPFGPPVRGWDQVEPTLERAVAPLREGEPHSFERISEYGTEDLAYVVEIERCPGVKVDGSEESTPFALRATTVWRREEGVWKIAHRHADPTVVARPVGSIFDA